MQTLNTNYALETHVGAPEFTVRTESRWYAVQTNPRHEKRVFARFQENAISSFLPLYASLNRWKDRTVRVQLPLFPGYIFVHIDLLDRLSVLRVGGVVRFVGFGNGATALEPGEVESLRLALTQGLQVAPHPYLKIGRRARVVTGPLQGMVGILVKKKNRERFVISLDTIKRAMAVEVGAFELEPFDRAPSPPERKSRKA